MDRHVGISRRSFLNQAVKGAAGLSLLAGIARGAEEGPVKKVHVIFKTHLDIGYTDLAANVIEKYRSEFIPAAVRLAKETREQNAAHCFRWTTGAWLIHSYLEQADADSRKSMEDAIVAGDICWHALPFTTHSEALDASLFEAGMMLSRNLDERFEKTTISAKMTDVPGHTRGIVPLLQRAGVRLFHIGVNGASMPPETPSVFVWQAPDASRVTVMIQKEYGGIMRIPHTEEVVAILFTGDNHGPQTAAQVAEAYRNLEEQFPGAEVVASDLNEVARVITGVEQALPILTAELGDSWIHGIGTDPWKIARMRELARLRKEWLASGPPLAGSPEDLAFSIPLALIGEHTWGLDAKSFKETWDIATPEALAAIRNTAPIKRLEASWQEKRQYLRDAVNSLSEDRKAEAQAALDALAPAPPDLSKFEKMANPGSLIETDALSFALDPDTGAVAHLKNLYTGREWASPAQPLGLFAYQRFAQADFDRFLAQYLTVQADWAIQDFGKPGLENIDVPGGIWLSRLKQAWRREEQDAYVLLAELEVTDEAGEVPPGCPRRLFTEYRVSKFALNLRVTLQWFEKPAQRLPEALWFSFVPVTEPDGAWTLLKMVQAVDPRDVVMNGGRKMHAIAGEVRYDDKGNALRIFTPDAPLVAPGERGLLNFDNALPDPAGGMHFCLCNNVWGTNFVMWFDDDMKFRFSLGC